MLCITLIKITAANSNNGGKNADSRIVVCYITLCYLYGYIMTRYAAPKI